MDGLTDEQILTEMAKSLGEVHRGLFLLSTMNGKRTEKQLAAFEKGAVGLVTFQNTFMRDIQEAMK